MPQVSFARDIRPLFRDVDISHMEAHGIRLDDYTFMSDPDNADKVLETLSRTKATRLPCHLRALLDSGPARVVRPVAERGLPALSARSRAAEVNDPARSPIRDDYPIQATSAGKELVGPNKEAKSFSFCT